tara:strand:- start:228 stop:1229 length:1002 start_codon:yes stop_codon:yes gene_type:complete
MVVHTGQNYTHNLNSLFYKEMKIRGPDIRLNINAHTFAHQIGEMIPQIFDIVHEEKPDRILILGDTNTALAAAIVSSRLGIPLYHMEAGNRCFDDKVPEEINRRLIDHSATVSLPYTHNSKENLLREGVDHRNIFVVGNPINEVLGFYKQEIRDSLALDKFKVNAGEYLLATVHRAENVDDNERLKNLMEGLISAGKRFGLPVLFSLHPRTDDKLQQSGMGLDTDVIMPFQSLGFFDFVNLEQNAKCVITDSGTVQEECCILGVPSITVRDTTERPETLECGSNILSGCEPELLLKALDVSMNFGNRWTPPKEYLEEFVSNTVLRLLVGYSHS